MVAGFLGHKNGNRGFWDGNEPRPDTRGRLLLVSFPQKIPRKRQNSESEVRTFPDFSFLCTSLTYQFTHVQYFLTPLGPLGLAGCTPRFRPLSPCVPSAYAVGTAQPMGVTAGAGVALPTGPRDMGRVSLLGLGDAALPLHERNLHALCTE